MSINKEFFIVIDKSPFQKPEFLYNVNFFYLRSYKKGRKKSFSFIRDPFFRGKVQFGQDIKGKMRPLRFEKIQQDGSIRPVDPRVFKKFIFNEKNQLIAFSDQTKPDDIEPILSMLKSFQYNMENVINLTFCKSCLDKDQFKILKRGIQIINLKGETICPDCALQIILRQAKVSGLVSQEKVSPKLKNFFRHMILRFKDVKKVLESFKPGFNPIYNKEMTLYDVEKSTPIHKKYLNYPIGNLNVPEPFKNLLIDFGIKKLLPIQALSIEDGLLSKRNNQLIMAPTSGGKTLIGEIAGVSEVLENKNKENSPKMLYVVPIVALANVREQEFKNKYQKLGLNVVKKVGESLLGSKIEKSLDDLNNADIIIGTYEAIDFILRSGNKQFIKNVKTVVVDEIQTLIDPERGFILDGFIARLKILFPDAQFLYLSATIGEPKVLARKLQSYLIRYNNRPVPVERHLILCLNEKKKLKFILKLVRNAFSQRSQYGFKGQSIVFTNTRKKCESISDYLQKRGLKSEPYHSGLTDEQRKRVEYKFQKQQIAGVVATAALAAGVDFPASQVIFESLAMGIKWLTVADFEQMLGRAGRLKKHDKGYAYLLVQPEQIYSPQMEKTEENIAIRLLNGKIKDFELEPNEDRSLTELLAFISMYNNAIVKDLIYKYYTNL
ncbi:MAG: DEAD/DEAH box helicase, partial [Promethearchaeota archaeon]